MSSVIPIRIPDNGLLSRRAGSSSRKHSSGQDGYALLIIIFMMALMTIAITRASLNIITNTRRDKEEEMIWRGRQYVRGIRLYYGKQHRFPTALDDLYKPKTGLRFMRQAYKDPMNSQDGSWRMIYVGPNGQLIGSLKDRSVNASGQATGGFGGAAGSQNMFGAQGAGTQGSSSSFFGSANGFGSASSFGSGGSNSNAQANPATNVAQGNAAANGQPAGADTSNSDSLQPHDLSDNPTIIGGNIIGVGSKINKKSIIWFEKAKNYRQYEFVWDPSVDSLTGQRPGLPTNSANPFGAQGAPGAPTSPAGGGMNPNPNPTQNPSPNPDPNQNPPLQAPPNQ
jgi:hypothetical protein